MPIRVSFMNMGTLTATVIFFALAGPFAHAEATIEGTAAISTVMLISS